MALSGFYPGFPNDIVLDHGALAIGDMVMTPSRGGMRFTPGVQYRRPPYDGERAEVEGMRRIVGWESMFSGVWYFTPNRVLPFIENDLTTTTPGGNVTKSVFLAPVPITKDNLNVVIDAGWISKEEACAGVAAGSVAACN